MKSIFESTTLILFGLLVTYAVIRLTEWVEKIFGKEKR